MTRTTIVSLLLLCFGQCSLVLAQQGQEPSSNAKTPASSRVSPDAIAAIRAGSQAFVAAFNKQDAAAIAALWTEEGEYIDETGRRYAGRERIKNAYAEFFENHPPVKLKLTTDSLRQVSSTIVMEEGRSILEPAPSRPAGVCRYSAVHVKQDGKWLTASVRDRWVETPQHVKSAADLQWLVGTWTAEENGVKTESVYRWSANRHFIERRYTTTFLDGSKSSGLQLIGWNAQGEGVQSWDFSPDGGHAVGIWSPTEKGWMVVAEGTTGKGQPTAAVNRLIRLDDNAYSWQSMQRSIGDVALPNTNEVVMKRQPK